MEQKSVYAGENAGCIDGYRDCYIIIRHHHLNRKSNQPRKSICRPMGSIVLYWIVCSSNLRPIVNCFSCWFPGSKSFYFLRGFLVLFSYSRKCACWMVEVQKIYGIQIFATRNI